MICAGSHQVSVHSERSVRQMARMDRSGSSRRRRLHRIRRRSSSGNSIKLNFHSINIRSIDEESKSGVGPRAALGSVRKSTTFGPRATKVGRPLIYYYEHIESNLLNEIVNLMHLIDN